MTRETRIGLLVGLVFIVMFGLILAEFTGGAKSAPIPAPAVGATDNTGTLHPLVAPEDAGTATPPAPGVAAGEARHEGDSELVALNLASDPSHERPVQISLTGPGPDPVPVKSDMAGGDTSPSPVPPPTSLTGGVDVKATPAGAKVYVVQDKDTLIKIVHKVYGASCNDYKKVMTANNLKSEKGLKIGMKLTMPPLDTPKADTAKPAPKPVTVPASPATPVVPVPVTAVSLPVPVAVTPPTTTAPATPVAVAGKTYTVKAGDNPSKIAKEVYGSATQANIDKLLKANKIDDPRKLKIGMTLQVPA